MRIQWLGHSCFRVEARGYAIVIDPYQDGAVPGLSPLRLIANEVLCSHMHGDHGCAEVVSLRGADQPSPFAVTRVETAHDGEGGRLRGMNTVHVLEADGIRLAHMGDLGHVPTDGQARSIGRLDALMLPVGGYYTIDAQTAQAVVRLLKPAVVLPMHYRAERFGYPVLGTLEAFTSLCDDAKTYRTDTLEITRDVARQTAVLAYLG